MLSNNLLPLTMLQATVQLLQNEGVKLNENPVRPVDTKLHSSSYVADNDHNEDQEWDEYMQWIKALNEQATQAFLRGIGKLKYQYHHHLDSGLSES